MKTRSTKIWMYLAAALVITFVLHAGTTAHAQQVVRVGYFPNISHPQALVGRAQGAFEKSLGPNVKVEWHQFNAGPSAIEALFAGVIDLTYIGPSPTINGYVQSHGEALRVIAGACSGGAGLVVRDGSGIQKASDFHGKRVGSPQLGNTQDVALRSWLHSQGLKTIDKGGDVQVVPLPNPDQLTLFLQGKLDASWAPEPWATRLIQEGHGHLFLDERTLWPGGKFISAHLIVRKAFLDQHTDLVKSFLRAHVDVTDWINAHPEDAREIVNQQIKADTGKGLSQSVINEAWARLSPTYDPLSWSLNKSAQESFDAGSLKSLPDLSHLYDLNLLNQVLKEKKKKAVQ